MSKYALVLVVLAGRLAYAEGSLHGSVSDTHGRIPGALVSLRRDKGPRTGPIRLATNDAGRYSFEKLLEGPYEVVISHPGYRSATQNVSVSERSSLDVVLEPEAIRTVLTVAATADSTTASRMEIADAALPAQVSSVKSTALEEQGVNSLAAALQNASGVSVQVPYGVYEYYTIRGFNQSDVLLVDGMRLEGNRINTQLSNVERVDVLKGPSSFLYGGQSLGGAINVIRKKPSAARTYDFIYRTGRFGLHQGGFGAAGQVFGLRRLLYRADASYEHSDGWRGAGADRLNVSPALTWLISEKTRVTVHQGFARDDFRLDAGIPVGVLALRGFDLHRRFNTPQDFEHARDGQTQVLLDSTLTPALRIRNSLFIRKSSDEYYSAEGLSYVPGPDRVDRTALYFKHNRRPVQNQLDLIGRGSLFGRTHSFLAGYEYQDAYTATDRSAGRSVGITPVDLKTFEERYVPVNDFPITRVDHSSNRIHALYWQDQVALTNRLKLNAGGRLDDYRRSTHNDPWSDGTPSGRGPESRRDQRAYTYRAGLVYSITEGQEAYFSSSTAFTPVTTVPADGSELKPETGRSFEVGHRWRAFNTINVSTAAYRIVRENVVIGRGSGVFDQAGRQSSRGLDVDVDGTVGKGVRVLANYGYSLPRFDNFLASNGAVDLSGFRPRFVQRHAVNAWLTKTWDSRVFASLGTRYMGPVFIDNNNTSKLGGWTTFRGAAGVRRGAWEWSVNAENLLNRGPYFVSQINGTQLYPGAPINIFTTLRLRLRP